MRHPDSINRRSFLKTTGAQAALTATALTGPSILKARGATDTIGVGHIGIGVRGGTLLTQVAGREYGGGIAGTQVTAVCDVYEPHLDNGAQRSMNPNVKTYVDYQDLLADPDVDAVVIATPDHWHERMVIDAAEAGKDVYIEKGWTRTLDEAKAIREAVKRHNIVMQLGHQSRELPAGIQAKELIQEGLLGPVTLVRTGRFENGPLGRNIWRWYGWYSNYDRPDEREVIEQLDWERWLGPAPDHEFTMERFWHWRCYWDYGTGVAGDLLSHEIDFVQAVLELGIPERCVSSGFNALLDDGREVPDTWNSLFVYEEKGCTVTFDCSMNSRALIQPPEFRGKDALLRFDNIAQAVGTFDVYAEDGSDLYGERIRAGEVPVGEPFMRFDPSQAPERPSLMQNFFDSIRERSKPWCNEDEAFIEAATLLMALEAFKQKREVRWDAEREEIV